MTTRYRINRPTNFPICETFDVESITAVISEEGCKFLRIYYGMKSDLSVRTILVAANAEGEDMLPTTEVNATTAEGDIILEDGYRCPPDCPKGSPLNGG